MKATTISSKKLCKRGLWFVVSLSVNIFDSYVYLGLFRFHSSQARDPSLLLGAAVCALGVWWRRLRWAHFCVVRWEIFLVVMSWCGAVSCGVRYSERPLPPPHTLSHFYRMIWLSFSLFTLSRFIAATRWCWASARFCRIDWMSETLHLQIHRYGNVWHISELW